jgi:hypothetical protein
MLMDWGLTSVQAECVIAVVVYELTYRQASQVLGRARGAVGSALGRARRRLPNLPIPPRGRPKSRFKPESQFGRDGISLAKLLS